MRNLNITIRHFIEIENCLFRKGKNQPGSFQFDPFTKEEVATLNSHVAKEAVEAESTEANKASGPGNTQCSSSDPKSVPTGPEDCGRPAPSYLPPTSELVMPSDSTTTPARAIRMVGILAKDKTQAYFYCSTCQAIFGHLKGLENHLKWNSKKDGSLKCGKERAKPDPNKPKAYQCNLCDKSFQTYAGLKGHVETVHKKIRHACHQCDKSFTQKSHLLKHHRTVHTVVNHRACPTCGETFTEKWSLDRHIRQVHQKLKPHKCNECGKVFGLSQPLKTHINMVHLKLKPHSCDECGKGFAQTRDLKRHINSVHKGLKPFACQICGETFGRRYSMNRHAKAVHQDKA